MRRTRYGKDDEGREDSRKDIGQQSQGRASQKSPNPVDLELQSPPRDRSDLPRITWKAPYRRGGNENVRASNDVIPDPPPDTPHEHPAENQPQREPSRLRRSQTRESYVPPLTRGEGSSNNTDSTRQAERHRNAGHGSEDNELNPRFGEPASDRERHEQTAAGQVHRAAANNIGQ
jgi:hypothetical protein